MTNWQKSKQFEKYQLVLFLSFFFLFKPKLVVVRTKTKIFYLLNSDCPRVKSRKHQSFSGNPLLSNTYWVIAHITLVTGWVVDPALSTLLNTRIFRRFISASENRCKLIHMYYKYMFILFTIYFELVEIIGSLCCCESLHGLTHQSS